MEPQSSIPVRASGIPRPTSRLPVLRASVSQSQLRSPSSTEQLRKRASVSSLTRPTPAPVPSLQKKTSRTSLARSNTIQAASANTSSARASLTSTVNRRVSSSAYTRPVANSDAPVFRKPTGRLSSVQPKNTPKPAAALPVSREDDVLGDLDGFRSASRASSRAGGHEQESDSAISPTEDDSECGDLASRRSRPSLADRTIESLSQLPSSPAKTKTRRRSSFFNGDNSMPPPLQPTSRSSSRPPSALGDSRPVTSDGPTRLQPTTPRRLGSHSQRGAMTAPGKRSSSATTGVNPGMTPSKTPAVSRSASIKKQPLAPVQNVQSTPSLRPLSNSKSMVARTPKARPSLASTFGQAASPSTSTAPATPSPRISPVAKRTPDTSRKVSTSSAALREQIAKAKAARRSDIAPKPVNTPPKPVNSSSALREQIAKAKEAARLAHATGRGNAGNDVGRSTPPREPIVPDPAEIAEFDFGLDDPFNHRPKGAKSLLRKRIDGARVDGRLNIAAMGLSEIPDEVLNMYKYDPDDNSVAWGEVVDLSVIIAADNELQSLPEKMFPDVDYDNEMDSDDDAGPQFGGIQNLDLHGNTLRELPMGLRRLTQLSKLNLSRNNLSAQVLDVITQIPTLRELKLAETNLEGSLPESIGRLEQLEVLELQNNQLSSLPSQMCELTRLRTLNVSENQLKDLPSELFALASLIELIATQNAFSGTFFHVDTMPNLQSLHLGNNALSAICEANAISLPTLKYLDLSANRLSSLPDMSSWTSLTTLLVGENKITVLPESFYSLRQLRHADFTGNDLTKLDEKLALMESLEILTVAANPLRERKFLTMNAEDIKRDLLSRMEPSGIDAPSEDDETNGEMLEAESQWTLAPSGTLDLSSKNLTGLDNDSLVSFAESNDVRQLYLQQNYLTSIPLAISHLANVTVLDLSKNNIEYSFTDTLHLPKLRELRLNNNKIQTFDEMTTFLSAPKLQQLNVSNNRIAGALPVMRKVFPDLFFLMASDNAITEVSAESINGLKVVNLSNNNIHRLEPRIGLQAGTLTSLDVEGNTFRVPNYAVLRKGTEAVLSWLRDKIPSPTEEFFDATEF